MLSAANAGGKLLAGARSKGNTAPAPKGTARRPVGGNYAPTYVARVDGVSKPAASSAPVGLTPAQVRHAYGIDQVFFGSVQGDGTGQTIAIVDAYDMPTIQSDLQAFDAAFGLPNPPSFTKVNQTGGSTLPGTDPGGPGLSWELETALDVEWAHAIAPGANILLVEANSASDADLIQAAVNYARTAPGVVAVSMSFGRDVAFPSDTTLDNIFKTPAGHQGVTFLASTGDAGQPGGYPAYSPNVVAVGGTSLFVDSAGNYLGENGWGGSGGGVSSYEAQPAYQNGVVTQNHAFRTTPDVAFVADPNTGVAVYDSYDFGTAGPWVQIGGTSLACPCWAGLMAVADQGRSLAGLGSLDGAAGALPRLYHAPASVFRDITTGNNGFAAGPGYDLVTGRGTPLAPQALAALATGPAGPYVVTRSPLGDQAGPVSAVDFNFSAAMDPASFSVAADVVSFTGAFAGGGNVDLKSQITGFSWTNANKTLHVTFNAQSADGTYSLVIGPQILSPAQTPLDQDFNGVAGEASDAVTATFSIARAVAADPFGYKAAAYPFENLSLTPGAAGVFTAVDNVDDGFGGIDLGANTFSFYGTTYSGANQLFVSSNGLITFGSGTDAFSNSDLTGDPAQPAIAPLWDDWLTGQDANDQVLYTFRDVNNDAAPDQLVVEWHRVQSVGAVFANSTNPATFQAILQLNTGATPAALIFNYPDLAVGQSGFDNGASSTVGISDASNGRRLLVSLDDPTSPLVGTGKAVRVATTAAPSVAGRYVFYNNSAYDGNDAAANAADDGAIALGPDGAPKAPLLPGRAASFANYTSYNKGINGLMVDVAGLADPAALSAADFGFKAGNDADPANWGAAPAPLSVSARARGDGSYRVEVVFADGAVQKQWLQVTLKSTANTGLAAPDVFYFGNAVGESGNSATDAAVTAADVLGARGRQDVGPVPLASAYDYNRDTAVNGADVLNARGNQTAGDAVLVLFTPPAISPGLASASSAPAPQTTTQAASRTATPSATVKASSASRTSAALTKPAADAVHLGLWTPPVVPGSSSAAKTSPFADLIQPRRKQGWE